MPLSSCVASTSGKRIVAAGIITACAALFAIGKSNWLFSTKMMATSLRRPNLFTINAMETHTGTVIFFHGLGDTGEGWSQMLRRIREPHLKYICPTALRIPVTLNRGAIMPSWFDLFSLHLGGKEDVAGIKKAVNDIASGIISEEESTGISSDRIMVGGFSQGGALALYSALTITKPLAGAFSLSSWLPLSGDFPKVASTNRNIPVLLCHGDSDLVVLPEVGQQTEQKLREFVPEITNKIYHNLGHSSNEEEMADVKAFISKCLPKNH